MTQQQALDIVNSHIDKVATAKATATAVNWEQLIEELLPVLLAILSGLNTPTKV